MENEWIKNLIEFHKAFDVPVLDNPQIPSLERMLLREKILEEEVQELREASDDMDIVKVADAIADVIYVTIGTACEFGLQDFLSEIFNEVHRSNMSKLDENGKSIHRDDGKVIKSKLYSPPNIAAILNQST